MLTELGLIYGAAVLLKYRTDQLGIFPNRTVVFQNDQDLRHFEPTEETKYYLLLQDGAYDFDLRVISGKQELWNNDFSTFHLGNAPIRRHTKGHDKKGLASLLKHIGEKITPDDVFYFATSRHSSTRGNWLNRRLDIGEKVLSGFWEGDQKVKLSTDELQEMLYSITAKGSVNVLYFDTCFAGDFARALGTGNNIAIASTAPGKILMIKTQTSLIDALEGRESIFTGQVTKTRYSFQEALASGRTVSEAFGSTKPERVIDWGMTGIKPQINHPHMYVGNVNPRTVYIR